ncbi:MAG: nucleotidyltransferase [Candidatus Hydrogenedentota bacterium]
MKIAVEREDLAAVCRRHHIVRLALFGSVLRDDFRPDSDVDVLAEFAAGHHPGWDIVNVEEDLSNLYGGHPVEILNPKYINPHLREEILRTAVLQYEVGHESE